MAIFSLKHLYTNTVLDGYVILCVCLFAIETRFPLSTFQIKHIFGILMVLQKYENNLGRHRRPNFFFTAADSVPDGVLKVPSFGAADASQFFLKQKRRRWRRFPRWEPKAALPRRTRETPSKAAVSRVYRYA